MNSTTNTIIAPNNNSNALSLNRNLGIVFLMVFTEFLIMGISLGVLPAFIHQSLQLSNIWVGVIIGAQYATTLLTRQLAGKMADHKGGKLSVITGIVFSALSGVMLLAAVSVYSLPQLSLILVLVGRILLGAGESFLVVGVFKWGFTIVGPANTGKVMVWNGMGMYAGMACGAPLAILLQAQTGLTTLFAITIVLPFIIYFIMQMLPAVPLPKDTIKLPFIKAVSLVWASGSALALASIGFGGIASFISLYFVQNHWQNASLALTAFGACYIAVRLFLSGTPDKFGGAKVALISLGVEIAGQLLIWMGINGTLTILGAAITGMGMSLIFPSLGQLAVKKVEPANRGMAIAAYNAFFDLGMGITAPLAGLIAGKSHYQYVYILGALAAIASIMLVYWEQRKSVKQKETL